MALTPEEKGQAAYEIYRELAGDYKPTFDALSEKEKSVWRDLYTVVMRHWLESDFRTCVTSDDFVLKEFVYAFQSGKKLGCGPRLATRGALSAFVLAIVDPNNKHLEFILSNKLPGIQINLSPEKRDLP